MTNHDTDKAADVSETLKRLKAAHWAALRELRRGGARVNLESTADDIAHDVLVSLSEAYAKGWNPTLALVRASARNAARTYLRESRKRRQTEVPVAKVDKVGPVNQGQSSAYSETFICGNARFTVWSMRRVDSAGRLVRWNNERGFQDQGPGSARGRTSYTDRRIDVVWEAIQALCPLSRMTVEQHYVQGWTVKQIAQEWGAKVPAIRRRLERAKEFIRACCAGEAPMAA